VLQPPQTGHQRASLMDAARVFHDHGMSALVEEKLQGILDQLFCDRAPGGVWLPGFQTKVDLSRGKDK
jgi:hypothetical protein